MKKENTKLMRDRLKHARAHMGGGFSSSSNLLVIVMLVVALTGSGVGLYYAYVRKGAKESDAYLAKRSGEYHAGVDEPHDDSGVVRPPAPPSAGSMMQMTPSQDNRMPIKDMKDDGAVLFPGLPPAAPPTPDMFPGLPPATPPSADMFPGLPPAAPPSAKEMSPLGDMAAPHCMSKQEMMKHVRGLYSSIPQLHGHIFETVQAWHINRVDEIRNSKTPSVSMENLSKMIFKLYTLLAFNVQHVTQIVRSQLVCDRARGGNNDAGTRMSTVIMDVVAQAFAYEAETYKRYFMYAVTASRPNPTADDVEEMWSKLLGVPRVHQRSVTAYNDLVAHILSMDRQLPSAMREFPDDLVAPGRF
jgi:hypothetical protein